MDYQFTITRRIVAVVIFLLAFLLLLFFLLGLRLGREWNDFNEKNTAESAVGIIKQQPGLNMMQIQSVKPELN